ncbi:MAG: DNA polymerase IV, partial [Nitrospirae bacterium]
GHSMTLPRDIYSIPQVRAYLLLLSDRVSFRARRYGYKGKTVTLIVRYKSFETFSVRKKLMSPTDDPHLVFRSACELLSTVRLREPVRLLGVSLGCLVRKTGQLNLFAEQNQRSRLLDTLDRINLRYGSGSLVWAATLKPERQPGVISPAWRPEGVHRSL